MGVILCDTHGRQGFYEVCAHIDAALTLGTVLPMRRILGVQVCAGCIARHGLERFAGEVFPGWSDEAIEQYHLLNADACCWCTDCIADVELAAARRAGHPDPFPAYERTLTHRERETVARLRAGLLATFDVPDSIVSPGRPAMHLALGASRRPLTLTLYGFTEPADQDAVLDWMVRFFAPLSQSQYRVRFVAAENWQQVSARHHQRGPEVLLREFEADPLSG